MVKNLLNGRTLQEIIQQHGIDVPIMRTRLVGERLELYLYGGVRIDHDFGVALGSEEPATVDYHQLPVKELQVLAKAKGIKGYSSMKKSVLVGVLDKVKYG